MVKYRETPKGYYYKIYKNGKKKRISHKEYYRNINVKMQQIGGHVPPYPPVHSEAISWITQSLDEGIDYCGNFEPNGEFLINAGEPNPGNKFGRPSCNYKYYSTFLRFECF